MGKIFRIKKLHYLYRVAACARESPDAPITRKFVPSWVKMQLRQHIGKGIMELEVDILNELDCLIYGPQSIGRQNPLAIWACLWLLILTYRGHFSFIHWFFLHEQNLRETLYGLGKHMYNTLTSVYAALYKTTSPLTFDWRTQEVRDMLGGDGGLVEAFINIKTEMFWLCKNAQSAKAEKSESMVD